MNKTIYAIIFIITAFNLNSQELDESFLESLPKDIKKDVLDRAAGKGENIEENFSSFQYSSYGYRTIKSTRSGQLHFRHVCF